MNKNQNFSYYRGMGILMTEVRIRLALKSSEDILLPLAD